MGYRQLQQVCVSISFGDLMSLEPAFDYLEQEYELFFRFNLLWRSNVIGTDLEPEDDLENAPFQSPLEI